jgi:hypothetical protein
MIESQHSLVGLLDVLQQGDPPGPGQVLLRYDPRTLGPDDYYVWKGWYWA